MMQWKNRGGYAEVGAYCEILIFWTRGGWGETVGLGFML